MIIVLWNEEMPYSLDLREKALSLIEKWKSKDGVADLLEVGIATLYMLMRKKAAGKSLKHGKNDCFIRKIDQEMLAEYVKNTQITR